MCDNDIVIIKSKSEGKLLQSAMSKHHHIIWASAKILKEVCKVLMLVLLKGEREFLPAHSQKQAAGQARPRSKAPALALCRALALESPCRHQHCRRPSQAYRNHRAVKCVGCECDRLQVKPNHLLLERALAELPAYLAGSAGQLTSPADAATGHKALRS